jgi:hypothetical protein
MSWNDTYDWILSYVGSPAYIPSAAENKREHLWVAGQKTRYVNLPPSRANMVTTALGIANIPLLRTAFHNFTDVRPPRTKVFHPFGTCAKIVWVPATGHPFTGLYESGAIGLARLSLAMDDSAFMPAGGFKFFIDGHESQNFLTFRNLDPYPVKDFFVSQPANVSDGPTKPPLGPAWFFLKRWMSLVSFPSAQPVAQLAKMNRYGHAISSPRSPFEIYATPTKTVCDLSNAYDDFRVSLARIPAGSVLYELSALASKGDTHTVPLGCIKTESEFTASAFGDHILAMHHLVSTKKDW